MKKILSLTSVILLVLVSIASVSSDTNRIEWNFDGDSTEGAWVGNFNVKGLKTTGGLLIGEATGSEPTLTSPQFSFKPDFYDLVEILIHSEKGGEAQLLWTDAIEKPDSGFTSVKSARFFVPASAARPIKVYPFWHKDEQIVKIRVVPPPGKFRISFIRVRHQREPIAPAAMAYEWRFPTAYANWSVLQGDAFAGIDRKGLSIQTTPYLVLGSPTLRVSSEINKYVIVKMKASAGKTGEVGWVTNSRNGMTFLAFDLNADGNMHTYEIAVSQSKDWSDQIRLIALKPSDAPEADVVIESVAVVPSPHIPDTRALEPEVVAPKPKAAPAK